MFSQQSTIFPKLFKIDDYESTQNNSLIILESSNLLLGSGARASSTAVVLAKTLQYLKQEGELDFTGKSVLELGCGVGLVGLFLAVMGSNVTLIDTAVLKDLIEKNININRKMLKGKVQFFVGSWKKTSCISDCKEAIENEAISTSLSNKTKQICLYHLSKCYDWTLVCQCGGMLDLQNQLKFMGREGMLLAFMKRQNWPDGLDKRPVEQYLNSKLYEYQKIQTYHSDYFDKRISIIKIYPLIDQKSEKNVDKIQSQGQNHSNNEEEADISQEVQQLKITQISKND